MSYHRKRGLGALGIDCTQPGSLIFAECQGAGTLHTSPGTPSSSPGAGTSGGTKAGPGAADVIGSFLKALTGGIGASTMTPAQPVAMPVSSGPSTTTIVAIGGAALLAVILLTRD